MEMPQKDTLDDVAYTCMLVSYHRHSPQFQFSLSAVTLWYLPQPGHVQRFCVIPEVEFLEEIQTEVLRVFLLAIHRHLY